MWKSAKVLASGVIRNWLQLIGGALMAVIALVAAIQSWTVPSQVWVTASVVLFAWSALKEFHELRMQFDVAAGELRDEICSQSGRDR